jgi:methylated-DNA-protein-cysteine methyltransferase-like protein
MGMTGEAVKGFINAVPRGRVSSYGAIAALAGLPNGARTVVRILHSSSGSSGLPWWRIIRADGSIALRRGGGFEEQAARLADEGVKVDRNGRVDMSVFGWPNQSAVLMKRAPKGT